ncbi:hypothetical protein CSAL01_07132, partial [Colletotrichum salicis]
MGMTTNEEIQTVLAKPRHLSLRLLHRRPSSAQRSSLPCLARLRAVTFRLLCCRLWADGTTRWRHLTRSSRAPPRSLLR